MKQIIASLMIGMWYITALSTENMDENQLWDDLCDSVGTNKFHVLPQNEREALVKQAFTQLEIYEASLSEAEAGSGEELYLKVYVAQMKATHKMIAA